MMKRWTGLIISIFLSHAAFANTTDSLYTSFSDKRCRQVDEYSMQCPGVGGYQLIVQEDDSRVSLVVVAPNKKEFPLDFWSVVTGHLTSLGKKAEWRVSKVNGKMVPSALIVRLTEYPFTEEDKTNKSILVISKITASSVCVTDKIDGLKAGANQLARKLADESEGKACLRAE